MTLALLAFSPTREWLNRLLGPDTPVLAICFFFVICLALLALLFLALYFLYTTLEHTQLNRSAFGAC